MVVVSLVVSPLFISAQGDPGPGTATLRLSLPAGTVIGSNADPWLSQGWLLNLTGNSWTFIVNVTEISSNHKCYDTHLIVALNDLAYTNLLSLVINGTAIPKAAFQYGRPEPYNLGWVWPDDVYPTRFNDTYINLGTLDTWESKNLNVSVTFSDSSGARMHFDAYGKAVPGQIKKKGDIIHNPNSEDSTVISAGAPPGIPPHAEFTYSPSYPIVSENVTFNASGSYDSDGYIVNYTWNFGDGNVTVVSNPIVNHHYVTYGNYTVTLEVKDNDTLTDYAADTVNVREYPVADSTISAPLPPYSVGDTVTLDGSNSTPNGGTIVGYSWDFGDNTTGNGMIVNHTYASPGNYTVTLNVTDSEGLSDTTSLAVSVNPLPLVYPIPNFTYSPSTPYTGDIVTFNATSSYDPDGYIVSYAWDFGDNTTDAGNVTTHSYADDGTYTVTLNVTDNDGLSSTVSANITVLNRPPVAFFTENATTIFVGETIHFNASGSYDPDGSIVSYLWDFGDGSNTTGVTVDHSYTGVGTYVVTLTVTDDDGATDSANATKQVNAVPNVPPVASFTENATTVLTGESISFNASASYDLDGFIVSYFWNFGDGANATGVTTVHSYADDGTFTVTLTITDDDGAMVSVNATKTVLNRPPVASFVENATTVLTGEAISFDASASSDPDGSINSYFWDFGDGTNATGVTTTHSYADDGTYTVNLTVTDDDSATAWTTTTKTVLNRPPVASFTENATTIIVGETINFDASGSSDPDGTIVTFFWNFGDGNNGTGVSVDHSYSTAGNYTVTLTVTDDDGATDSVSANKTALELVYYLTVETGPGGIVTIPGEGWYGNSTLVILTAPAPVSVSPGVQYRFDYWDVDGASQGSGVNPITVQIDANHTATAHYILQYYLTVISPYGTPGGEGWYDNGTYAYATLDTGIVDHGNGTRRVFTHWSGDASGTNYTQSDPIHMDGPKTASANWKTQYLVTFAQTGLDNTANNTVVTVNGAPKNFSILPFEMWADDGSSVTYNYSTIVSSTVLGKRFRLDSVSSPPSPFTVTGPVTITGNYQTQYYLTMNTNFGTVTPSSGWHDAGSTVQINASAPSAVGGERYVWLGWTGTGNGSYSSTDNPASITMNGPITETATWRHEYYLTVNSPHDSPAPTSGWFEAGSSITASVTSPWPGPAGIRYVCTGWTGTGSVPASGTTKTVTFTINAPSSITWNWKTQYYLTVKTDPTGIGTIPGQGWYDSSTVVPLTAPTLVNYNFINWDVDGASQGSGVNPISVHMDGPHTATAHYQREPGVQPVGGSAVPIDKSLLLAPTMGSVPWVGLAIAFLAAVAVVIILIRRGNKIF